MAKLSRIANVTIQLATTGITELSFSDGMLFGITGAFLQRKTIITGADELLDLGVPATDPMYRAAAAWFAALPAARQLHVGRWMPGDHKLTIQPAVRVGNPVGVKIAFKQGGTTTTETVSVNAAAADPSAVATALAAAIDAKDWPMTAEAAGSVITITGTGVDVAVSSINALIGITYGEPIETVEAALSATNGNWYGLIAATRHVNTVKGIANWAEANEKLFGTATDDEGAFDPDGREDIAAWAMQQQLFRTFVMATPNDIFDGGFPEATLMSSMFTYYPGQETWSLKKLPGVAYDELNEGQATAAHAKNATTFELFRNFAVTQGGKVAAGEWIDVIRLRDQLVESIRVSVVSAMINADGKIPYTDGGIAIIENAIRGPLNLNVTRGGIAPVEMDLEDNPIPSYVITVPRSAAVPFNDKANRVLNDVKFSARLAGAIHVVNINGRLSYTL